MSATARERPEPGRAQRSQPSTIGGRRLGSVVQVGRSPRGFAAIVVLLILVVVWAAILAPGLLRRMRDRRSEVAIGEFHRHLRVLQRTGPAAMRPAFRLQHRAADGGDAPGAHGPDFAPTLTLVQPAATLVQRTVSSAARPVGVASTGRGKRPDPFFAPGRASGGATCWASFCPW